MAVEIKEVIIRATVDYPSSAQSVEESPIEPSLNKEADQSLIVNACVKQVLKILRQKEKR